MTDANVDTSALAGTLAEEGRLYVSLLDLSVREERAIVSGDVESLTRFVDEKEQLLELLAVLETERMTALTAISEAVGIQPDRINLTMVCEHASPSAGGALRQAGMLLRAQAVALKQANERNVLLLHTSSDLIDRWIQYLKVVIRGNLTYNEDGSADDPSGPYAIDRAA